jgi:predicted enzyme related to lactoylglutathione lyase
MSEPQGRFVWYELMTSDPQAAERFYGAVLGWTAKDAGMPDMHYTLLHSPAGPVGGLLAIPPNAEGAQPGWMGYISVPEVDAAAERVRAAGGAVHHGPADIPGVGRFAVVNDPQGAMFDLFSSSSEPPPAVPPETPGHVGWRELHTTDWEAALAFYGNLFGWAKGTAMDMGPMGTYQIFDIDGTMNGGIMNRQPQMPVSFWLFYFNVADIDAAAAKATGAGGSVLNGPHQVPGGHWIVQCLDPQGAMFALVGPRAEAA